MLTGKYRRGEPAPPGSRLEHRVDSTDDATWERVEMLEHLSAACGRSLLELAIAALAARPGVASVIAGRDEPGQVRQNAAAGDWRLGADELAALGAL